MTNAALRAPARDAFAHEHTLIDGRRVLIRPVRDDDGRLERGFLSALSGDSRYLSQVLGSNTAMLRFARGLGFEVEHAPGDMRTVRIVKKLRSAAGDVVSTRRA